MAKEIEYQGIKYKVNDDVTLNDLLQSENFKTIHENKMRDKTYGLLRGAGVDVEKQLEDEASKSGFATAIRSGLSNDQGYQMAWLANRRFPEYADGSQGINPVDFYFIDEDKDIAYIDPTDGKVKKEFAEAGFGIDMQDIGGKFAPTLQFVSETVPGVFGYGIGAMAGGFPGAAVAGGTGTLVGGTASYLARDALSATFDGPPLNTEKAKNDLKLSAGLSAVPFGGVGGKKTVKNFLSDITAKFKGEEGKSALKTLTKEGGDTVDDKINFAKQKFGITLTRGEASGILNNASQIQRYLQMQPGSQKLWDFYHNRAAQVEEVAEKFFEELRRGVYSKKMPKDTVGKILGKDTQDIVPDETIAQLAEQVQKNLAKEAQRRTAPLYKKAYELDLEIDISDIYDKAKSILGDPNLRGPTKKLYQTIVDSLEDKSGFSATGLKNNTELLHNTLKNDFRPLIEGLTKDGQKFLKAQASQIREEVATRIKDANPIFRQAQDIYAEELGHAQILERGLIGALAKAHQLGGDKASRVIDKMFKGTASPKDLQRTKDLLMEADPQAWQNVKAYWLTTQFDEAVAGSANILGAPNKFLRSIGVGSDAQKLIGRGASASRAKKVKALQQILEPDELAAFADVAEMMQAVSFIATKTGSPTQPLLALRSLLENETKGIGSALAGGVRAIVELPSRILLRGFDDSMKNTLNLSREAYEDKLIQILIDPEQAKNFGKLLKKIRPMVQFSVQSAVRSLSPAGESLSESLSEDVFGEVDPDTGILDRGTKGAEIFDRAQDAQKIIDDKRRLQEQMQQIDDSQTNINLDLFDDLPVQSAPSGINPALSPTLLPSEEDREIAMRMQQPGIAGLMV